MKKIIVLLLNISVIFSFFSLCPMDQREKELIEIFGRNVMSLKEPNSLFRTRVIRKEGERFINKGNIFNIDEKDLEDLKKENYVSCQYQFHINSDPSSFRNIKDLAAKQADIDPRFRPTPSFYYKIKESAVILGTKDRKSCHDLYAYIVALKNKTQNQ